jgi:hypothetical protein
MRTAPEVRNGTACSKVEADAATFAEHKGQRPPEKTMSDPTETTSPARARTGGSLHRAVRGPAWSASKAEEVIAGIYLIAALLAWNGGIIWLAVLLFIKAAADTVCALTFAAIEVCHESKQPSNVQEEP